MTATAKNTRTRGANARKRPTRTEEIDVIVRASGPHEDLLDLAGILFLDHDRTGRPYEATFEPSSAKVQNAILPVHGMLKSDQRIMLRDDEGVSWQFEVLDEDEDEPDLDYDTEHPFNS